MKTLLTNLLIFSTIFCFAQNTFIIDIYPKKINLPKGNFYVTKVIDARPQKDKIGIVYITGKMEKANFLLPFEESLFATLAQMHPYNKGGEPIVVKVHHFLIKEKEGETRQISQLAVKLEFFSLDKHQSYGVINVTEETIGTNATQKHSATILKALEKCLLQFDSIEKKEHLIITPSFLTGKAPKAGLYYSFTEMVLNQPKTPKNQIELESEFSALGRYKLKTKGKNALLKSLYGISDGNNFYSKEQYFIKVDVIGPYFYFEDIIYNRYAQMALGILGSALFEKKVGIIIDTNNGEISVLSKDFFLALLNPHPELLKMYKDSKKKLSIKKTILKKLNQKLSKMAY